MQDIDGALIFGLLIGGVIGFFIGKVVTIFTYGKARLEGTVTHRKPKE